jgi:hypothetical protein
MPFSVCDKIKRELGASRIMDQIPNGSGTPQQNIVEINRQQTFSYEDAQDLLPIIFRITKTHSQKVDILMGRLEGLSGEHEQLVATIEGQVSSLISEWQNKIQKLGAMPKGLWIADFDAGDGYYCWKYPEPRIEFWHSYNDGFSKRLRVSERRKPISLQDRLKNKIFKITPIGLQPSEIRE